MKVNVERLKIAQAQKCLSNIELCRKAEIGALTLLEIKNGKRKSPTLKTVGKIAKALNVDVTELLETKK